MSNRANWKGLEDVLIKSYEKCNGDVAMIVLSDEKLQRFTETQINSKIRELKRAGVLNEVLSGNGIVF